MRIIVLSDTHIPLAAHDLPKEIYDEIEKSDMIIHAGDFIEKPFFDKLQALKEMKAVCGNMDAKEIGMILRPKEVFVLGNFKIGLIHGYGAPSEIMPTVRREFDKVDVIIYGHSHKAADIRKDGILYFNPGSPTDKIFAPKNSYGILEIANNKIEGRIIEL